jgi:hypothetical protein
MLVQNIIQEEPYNSQQWSRINQRENEHREIVDCHIVRDLIGGIKITSFEKFIQFCLGILIFIKILADFALFVEFPAIARGEYFAKNR